MKRWTILLASLAALAVAGYVVTAQQPVGAGGAPDDQPARRDRSVRDDGNDARVARQAPAKSGIVSEFTKNPDGDTAGLRLDDGTEARFPPTAGEKVTSAVALKDRVTIEGWTHPGESEIHAATIKNETSGKTLVVDQPPPEVAQNAERSRQGGSNDRADDRKRARDPDADARGPQAKLEEKPKPKGRESGNSPAGETANARPVNPASAGAKPAPGGPAKTGPLSGFVLRSSEVAEGGTLPKEFTGDGSGATLPLQWSGVPTGTRSFSHIMHHEAPDGIKWYWVLYNIPADVTSLPKNVKGIGTLGNNSINRDLGYAPPHSKGPGAKKYTLTVYALSAAPQIAGPADQVSRDVLLAAMKDSILATADLNVIYSRGEQATEGDSNSASEQAGPPQGKNSLRPAAPGRGAGGEGRARPDNPPQRPSLDEAGKPPRPADQPEPPDDADRRTGPPA